MEHEVYLSAQCFLGFYEEIFKVCHAGSIGWDNNSVGLLCQFVDCSHAAGYGRVGQCYLCTFFYGAFRYFPSY